MTMLASCADRHGRDEREVFSAQDNTQVCLRRRITPGQPAPTEFSVSRRKWSQDRIPFESTDQTVDEVTFRCLCAAKRIACQGRLRHGGYTFEEYLSLIEKAKQASQVVDGYLVVVDVFLLLLQGLGLFKESSMVYSRGYGECKDSNRLGVCFLPKK